MYCWCEKFKFGTSTCSQRFADRVSSCFQWIGDVSSGSTCGLHLATSISMRTSSRAFVLVGRTHGQLSAFTVRGEHQTYRSVFINSAYGGRSAAAIGNRSRFRRFVLCCCACRQCGAFSIRSGTSSDIFILGHCALTQRRADRVGSCR